MYYLDQLYKIAHDSTLTQDEVSLLREKTDALVWRCNSDLSFLDEEHFATINQKIISNGQYENLRDLLSHRIDIDYTDLDENVAGIH